MKYYKYIRKSDKVLIFKVHQAVRNCKNLAISKYGSNWEDALDDAYFHILDHYDETQGSLQHYATSIVGKIYLNKFAKEVGSDIVYDIESDKQAQDNDKQYNEYESIEFDIDSLEYSEELNSCIQYLIPFFIKDYELFRSKDSSTRKLDYSGLFEKFSFNAICETVKILADKYYDNAKYIRTLSKGCHVRNFKADRYKSSLDKTLSYLGRIGDIVKCKLIGTKRKKFLYTIDLNDLLDKIFIMFYSKEGLASIEIEGNPVYCSLSGNIVFSKEDLYDYLEREIIGSVLALRSNLKVLHYTEGKEIILTSTKEDEQRVILSMFNTGVYIPLKRLILGKIVK